MPLLFEQIRILLVTGFSPISFCIISVGRGGSRFDEIQAVWKDRKAIDAGFVPLYLDTVLARMLDPALETALQACAVDLNPKRTTSENTGRFKDGGWFHGPGPGSIPPSAGFVQDCVHKPLGSGPDEVGSLLAFSDYFFEVGGRDSDALPRDEECVEV